MKSTECKLYYQVFSADTYDPKFIRDCTLGFNGSEVRGESNLEDLRGKLQRNDLFLVVWVGFPTIVKYNSLRILSYQDFLVVQSYLKGKGNDIPPLRHFSTYDLYAALREGKPKQAGAHQKLTTLTKLGEIEREYGLPMKRRVSAHTLRDPDDWSRNKTKSWKDNSKGRSQWMKEKKSKASNWKVKSRELEWDESNRVNCPPDLEPEVG